MFVKHVGMSNYFDMDESWINVVSHKTTALEMSLFLFFIDFNLMIL